ncbi:hypothetical protein NFHSH190041_31690 [Shewanella sp. NFH-SH190041]|uniref:DUF4920 domain-containing protein n=1 Tax=Shewanella sp. NFH-SH190041 TaxID=2950245 RepID=UPI0021C34330|nr:DUF4920 domain-containing protein [Shewanella sp. NFH-SH190041]BDM65717.1 hypothetical protein NFHSH190041_31690 [Shewanella sp. NFH-SH190041]
MKPLLLCLATLCVSGSVLAAPLQFGTGADDSKLTPISQVLADPIPFLTQPVTVKGTIVGVCEKRGCWVKLASDKRFQQLRIKVKDGDMVFPLSTKGRDALATGTLQPLEYDLDTTRRILANNAQQQGETFDPASVTTAMTVYQLVPTGVTILD